MAAHFHDILPLSTWPRYLLWHFSQRNTFQCTLKNGVRLSIRPLPSRDFDTVYEVFHAGVYACELEPARVRRIVDLGGNVGYTCLLWCLNYPNATVLTFEPHPDHCRLLKGHIEANGYSGRVELVSAAAGVCEGVAYLVDNDTASAVVSGGSSGSLEIRMVDFFGAVPAGPIDILKIDIEGSEYPILADPRFVSLASRTECVLLEWHARGANGEAVCRDRLGSLGFAVESESSAGDRGMLYARKRMTR